MNDIIIITGISGAGKSKVVDAFEDIGFVCVDNMPPKLIPTFAQLLLKSNEENDKIAIVTDVRAGGSFNGIFSVLEELKQMSVKYKILFIDASNDVLISRFKETRRTHPLLDKCGGSLNKAISSEREMLYPIRQIADYVIDTSSLSPADCKKRVCELFMGDTNNMLKIHCMSFGFKYGIPNDPDLMFDVRCLPNPFYIPELKTATGIEKEVRDYVMKWEESNVLKDKLIDLCDYLVPLYIREGKSRLVIAFGCTGGRHRSVVFAELLAQHFQDSGFAVSINHRDISK